LAQEDVAQIVDLQMKSIAERLSEQGLTVELSESARLWLAAEGFDADYGARPLRRALQHHIESPLSVKLLKNEFKAGDVIQVDTDGESIVFVKVPGGSYLVPSENDTDSATKYDLMDEDFEDTE
jgi:ATP-dependent Clp protease ATP-binding subunit ClpA